jgi:hypothetical protein
MKKIYFLYHKSCHLFVLIFIIIALLSSCADRTSDTNKNITQDSSKNTLKPKNDSLNKKVSIEITGKDFQHGDPKDTNDIKDYNVIIYKLTNNTDNSLRQVEADVVINDLSGNEVKKVKINYIEGIPAHSGKEYRALYNFNAFNEKDAALKSMDLKSIKFDSNILNIGY